MMHLSYALIVLAGLAGGIYLVEAGHYGWAWIPFLVAASVEMRSTKK